MPPSPAQSPVATTNFGSGVACQVRRSASAMLRVTGPVTIRQSAWRGEATKCTPNRSRSECGPVRPPISSSQPLHEPASTWRMASERPKRARISSASRAPSRSTSSVRAGGSVTRPCCMARASWRSMRSAPPCHALLALQLAQHVLRALEVAAEDLACDVEQLADRGVAHRVAHRHAVFARLDHVLGAQASQMLRDDRLVELQRLLQLLHAAAAVPENLQDSNADGMAKRLEELCFERLQLETASRLGHESSNIAILLYSQSSAPRRAASAASYTANVRAIVASIECSASTTAWPRRASARARAGSRSRSRIAAARAGASAGGTRRPVSP